MIDAFDLIEETTDFLIINKRCEIAFEGEDGILSLLRKNFKEIHGVHRLDKATSGLMIFAKNKEVQKKLSLLFASRKMKKKYIALSMHRPQKKMGRIKGDLIKGRGGSYYLSKEQKNPSQTSFKSYFDEKRSLRVFLLEPYTGQTHQLRVHLKSISSAILGDMRYGSDPSDRMYLAATSLNFQYKDVEYKYKFVPNQGEHFVSNDFLRKIIDED